MLPKRTESLCPECLAIIPAEIYESKGKVRIRKLCPQHGEFDDLYWGSSALYAKAEKFAYDARKLENPNIDKGEPLCPKDCGLCSLHMGHTALANIVVTNRCDLACWYCFFYAQKAGFVFEPSLEEIRSMVRSLRAEKPVPCNAIQLTGGEPTLREDLLDIIRICKEEGIEHVQLNTDGIRLATDPQLALKVRGAGVNTVYMSFDGLSEKTNPKNYREAPIAIENCRRAGMGIVLVPTIIKSINDEECGPILDYAVRNMDVIRGVNYQPVSLVGRMPRADRERFRITIPDVLQRIETFTGGQVVPEDFFPVPAAIPFSNFVEAITNRPQYQLASHFACGMATYIFVDEAGRLVPVTRFVDVEGLLEYLRKKAEELREGRSKYVVGAQLLYKLGSFINRERAPKGLSLARLVYNVLVKHDYGALADFHHRALFVGLMHFQDLYNYDIERVKHCCIHYVIPDGRIIPFCTFNVLPELYRDPIHEKYGVPTEEWERRTGRRLTDDYYRRPKDLPKAMASSIVTTHN
ncbi:MAG: radical SAM protein [Candidatus Bathyarchaeia archaeon]